MGDGFFIGEVLPVFSSMFNPQNGFWQGIARFSDLIGLSLCWLFCSLPLVTLGAATTALYDAVFHGVRKGEDVVYGRFFRTFKGNLKTATLFTLMGLVVALVCLWLWWITYSLTAAGLSEGFFFLSAYQILFCLPLAIWLLGSALLSRFTFGIGGLLKTSFRLAVAQLPRAFLVALMAVICTDLCLRYLFPMFLLPGLWALGASLFYEKIFAPFLPPEE